MVTKVQKFGKLNLQFTGSYTLRWNDQGSGGSSDGGFWHPVPPSGFHALGSIGRSNYNDPNGNVATLCVQESDSGKGALAKPTDYERIWADNGSGSRRDGSCWRPIPPKGYVALGDVFNSGYNKPSVEDIRCVQEELVYSGVVEENREKKEIWNDRNTGSRVDFSAWPILAPEEYVDETAELTRGLIAPGTFVGVATHAKPESILPVMHVLRLPIPLSSSPDSSPEHQTPRLESREMPASETMRKVDRAVIVPFTAIIDKGRSDAWKMQNSPFYLVQRETCYSRVAFNNNETSVLQTTTREVTVGISKTEASEFSTTTGISATTETGISFKGFTAGMSVTISLELGWSRSTSVEEFRSQTISQTLSTPPNTSAALWSATYELKATRQDGSQVSQPLAFDVNSFFQSQYPSS